MFRRLHKVICVLKLPPLVGVYIYESSWGQNRVRAHEGPEIRTLADYRRRYETYKSDPQLQMAHAAAPWIVTWDTR